MPVYTVSDRTSSGQYWDLLTQLKTMSKQVALIDSERPYHSRTHKTGFIIPAIQTELYGMEHVFLPYEIVNHRYNTKGVYEPSDGVMLVQDHACPYSWDYRERHGVEWKTVTHDWFEVSVALPTLSSVENVLSFIEQVVAEHQTGGVAVVVKGMRLSIEDACGGQEYNSRTSLTLDLSPCIYVEKEADAVAMKMGGADLAQSNYIRGKTV